MTSTKARNESSSIDFCGANTYSTTGFPNSSFFSVNSWPAPDSKRDFCHALSGKPNAVNVNFGGRLSPKPSVQLSSMNTCDEPTSFGCVAAEADKASAISSMNAAHFMVSLLFGRIIGFRVRRGRREIRRTALRLFQTRCSGRRGGGLHYLAR